MFVLYNTVYCTPCMLYSLPFVILENEKIKMITLFLICCEEYEDKLQNIKYAYLKFFKTNLISLESSINISLLAYQAKHFC